MLQLFQSIFGSRNDTPFPEELIERAIERAVDGTDPRLRGLPGYKKKLRPAVIRAIEHVIALVDALPPPLVLSRDSLSTDPELIAYFASLIHAREILEADPALKQWRESERAPNVHAVALLLMEQRERQVFGIEYEGDMLRRDVAQTTVSFAAHRLLDPASEEADTRRLLKRRAYDYLLTQVLARIATAHSERAELEHQRYLLRRKQTTLAKGSFGFDAETSSPIDPTVLQQQLDDIESHLKALGAGPGLLNLHLDLLVDILGQAENQLWGERFSLIVDRMGIKQSHASTNAPELSLARLRNASGRQIVLRLVDIAPEMLLQSGI